MLPIILAAGRSRRMGMPKALLKLPSGRTLLEDQCIRLLAAGCRRIIVVVGADTEKINKKFPPKADPPQAEKIKNQELKIEWIYNPNWRLGQFSSIQIGLKSAVTWAGTEPRPYSRGDPLRSPSILILPVDVPGISLKTIKMLIKEAKTYLLAPSPTPSPRRGEGGSLAAVVPRFEGRSGHPVILLPKIIRKILRLNPKAPSFRLDYILKKTRGVVYVDTDDPAVVRNVNTWGEWEEIRQTVSGGDRRNV